MEERREDLYNSWTFLSKGNVAIQLGFQRAKNVH